MTDILTDLSQYVVSGIENCLDNYEDRDIIGGPVGGLHAPTSHYEYAVTINGEDFLVSISPTGVAGRKPEKEFLK
jgi:hypothetical protein